MTSNSGGDEDEVGPWDIGSSSSSRRGSTFISLSAHFSKFSCASAIKTFDPKSVEGDSSNADRGSTTVIELSNGSVLKCSTVSSSHLMIKQNVSSIIYTYIKIIVGNT